MIDRYNKQWDDMFHMDWEEGPSLRAYVMGPALLPERGILNQYLDGNEVPLVECLTAYLEAHGNQYDMQRTHVIHVDIPMVRKLLNRPEDRVSVLATILQDIVEDISSVVEAYDGSYTQHKIKKLKALVTDCAIVHDTLYLYPKEKTNDN
jgi:hypothetical protein